MDPTLHVGMSSQMIRGFRQTLRKLEVSHDESLSYSQLFLAVRAPTASSAPFTQLMRSLGTAFILHQNDDLLPVPAQKRTWRAWNFVAL